ncbi:hypothetical protein ACFLQI_02135 [Candidatus Undinarchaeota archaeon]
MKAIQFTIVFVSLFLVLAASGCTGDTPFIEITGAGDDPICNPPYILVGTECCLDTNNNAICDGDESTTGEEQDTGSIN